MNYEDCYAGVLKCEEIDFLKLGGLDFSNQIVEWNFLGNKFYHVSISVFFFFFTSQNFSSYDGIFEWDGLSKNSLPIAISSSIPLKVDRLMDEWLNGQISGEKHYRMKTQCMMEIND